MTQGLVLCCVATKSAYKIIWMPVETQLNLIINFMRSAYKLERTMFAYTYTYMYTYTYTLHISIISTGCGVRKCLLQLVTVLQRRWPYHTVPQEVCLCTGSACRCHSSTSSTCWFALSLTQLYWIAHSVQQLRYACNMLKCVEMCSSVQVSC